MKKKQTSPSIAELENTILEDLDNSLKVESATSSEEEGKKEISKIIDEAVSELSDLQEPEKLSPSESKAKDKESRAKDKISYSEDMLYHHPQQNSKEIPESMSKDALVLALSNHVKIAEKRIKELEADNNQLRLDNNKIIMSGDTLQSSYDRLLNEHHTMKENYDEDRSSLLDQKKSLEQAMSSQSAELRSLRMKIDTLEKHLNKDVQKIRTRERDLENRLQFKQKELDAVIREKDEDLLNMKREVDELRDRLQDAQDRLDQRMHQQSIEKDRSSRVARALQMSLHLLEGDKENPSAKKESTTPVVDNVDQDDDADPVESEEASVSGINQLETEKASQSSDIFDEPESEGLSLEEEEPLENFQDEESDDDKKEAV